MCDKRILGINQHVLNNVNIYFNVKKCTNLMKSMMQVCEIVVNKQCAASSKCVTNNT